jgi:hypothetical protein
MLAKPRVSSASAVDNVHDRAELGTDWLRGLTDEQLRTVQGWAQQEQGHEVYALHLLGEIASPHEAADFGGAGLKYFEALGLGEKLGMRPLVAHCYLGLGKLYRRTGKREKVQEHLTTATTMYREMGMSYWLEKAEAELKVLVA